MVAFSNVPCPIGFIVVIFSLYLQVRISLCRMEVVPSVVLTHSCPVVVHKNERRLGFGASSKLRAVSEFIVQGHVGHVDKCDEVRR